MSDNSLQNDISYSIQSIMCHVSECNKVVNALNSLHSQLDEIGIELAASIYNTICSTEAVQALLSPKQPTENKETTRKVDNTQDKKAKSDIQVVILKKFFSSTRNMPISIDQLAINVGISRSRLSTILNSNKQTFTKAPAPKSLLSKDTSTIRKNATYWKLLDDYFRANYPILYESVTLINS